MANVKGTCGLCLEDKTLCNAHIVPKSFFRHMYPDSKISGKPLIGITTHSNRTKRVRIGFYDPAILCKDCDNRLGREFDEHGPKIFLHTQPTILHTTPAGDLAELSNIDYRDVTLFCLSVLWRMSLSKKREFDPINLGPFEARIRDMLLNPASADVDNFSIIITRFKFSNPRLQLRKVFMSAVTQRIDQVNYIWLYLLNGYKIIIKVDSRRQVPELAPLSIGKGKPVYVMEYEEYEDSKEFKFLVDEFVRVHSHLKANKDF